MKGYFLIDAISCIDDDLIEHHLKHREYLKNRKARRKASAWLKGSIVVAACCLLIASVSVIRQYIPVRYELDYKYTENNEEIYIADENVWIYYVEGTNIKRERVNLPCTAENIFITWRYLNNVGDEVTLISYEVTSNGTVSSSEFEGDTVVKYEQGDYFILNITVSENLKDYCEKKNSQDLITSLKRSMTEYSNIEFDEVNIIFN